MCSLRGTNRMFVYNSRLTLRGVGFSPSTSVLHVPIMPPGLYTQTIPTLAVTRKTDGRNQGTFLLFRITGSTGWKRTFTYRAVVPAVSRLPLIVEPLLRLQFGPCEIFLWTQWYWARFLPQYVRFPLSISFRQCFVVIFISFLFLPGQTGESW